MHEHKLHMNGPAPGAGIRACIFDLDGTLLDSMPVWRSVDIEFLRRRGIVMPDDYPKSIRSMSIREAAAYTIERFGLAQGIDEVCLEWNSMAGGLYVSNIEMKPFAYEYLLALKEHGFALSVATSLSESLFGSVLQKHGLAPLFDTVCSTEELGKGKDNPDVFLLAAERMQAAPQECVVYDDLLDAIRSAKAVGMRAVAVYDESSESSWPQIKAMADGVITDFAVATSALSFALSLRA